jgi:hypothetical protein
MSTKAGVKHPSRRNGKASAIEAHPDRARIELDIGKGTPVRVIMRKYGLSKDSIYRHIAKMPEGFRAESFAELLKPGVDLETLRRDESEGLLAHLTNGRIRLQMLRDAAEERGDALEAARLAAEIRKHLELAAKLLGQLDTYSKTTINIAQFFESNAYKGLEAELLALARAHPEARSDISAMLGRLIDNARTTPAPQMIEGRAIAG